MATLSFSPLKPNTLFSSFLFPSKNLSSRPIIYTLPHRNTPPLTFSAAKRPPAASATNSSSSVTVETVSPENDANSTVFVIRARNRTGLLQVITRVFNILGLSVEKATVDFEEDYFVMTFFVTDSRGNKIDDQKSLESINKALIDAIDGDDDAALSVAPSDRGVVVRKPRLDFGERKGQAERMLGLMDVFLKNDPISLQKDILHHVEYTVARSRFSFDDFEAYQALAHSVRDRLIERWHDTLIHFKKEDPKRVYFLSLEFLMGRSLSNIVINLGIRDQFADALSQLGFDFEVLAEQHITIRKSNCLFARRIEYIKYIYWRSCCVVVGDLKLGESNGWPYSWEPRATKLYDVKEGDACLGNGGLARLSACQMDSLATLDYPAVGYGLRYQYGLFRQVIVDGFQHEQPDYWLNFGNPWEIERVHITYPVKFYGTVTDEFLNGEKCKVWVPGEMVEAVAYDNPIPGYGTRNTINLRLWAAKPSDQHDMESFNTGDYVDAVVNRQRAESISSILYPDDRSYQGKELRLKQQYFFVSASVQDIFRRFKDTHKKFDEFPEKVALQLNDTHPSLAIAEVMRVLLDEEHLSWHRAWDIICKIFSFTTHTVSPEGLEKIPVDLLGNLLPRHLQIIYDINFNFVEELKKMIGLDYDRLTRMSIVEEGAVKNVMKIEVHNHPFCQNIRMANLSVICSHTVNGVSRLHSELLRTKLFKDFYDLWPHKFQYKTNGVTQRRWIVVSNPSLCALISKWLGTEAWIRDIDLLIGLRDYATNAELHQEWKMVKKVNKIRLAEYIEAMSGLKVSLDAMFDVQTKRIHEYKRQLLNILGIIHRYDCIKNMDKNDRKNVVPRVCIIGGKAAPGYEIAKKIIKLCHVVAERINNDNDIGDLLKLVFIPDYNVSVAEMVIPGADLSQHLSTAGHEASGTGSMKFLMNGCLLLATADGSTIEMVEEIGQDNMFLFGAKAHEVVALRKKGPTLKVPLQFSRVVRMIRDGHFGFEDYFKSLCDKIEGTSDYFLLGADFMSYLEAQAAADKAFVDEERWTKMSILSAAGSGRFSSDRTIQEYAENTWDIQPCRCPF
ncbi:hypothetical protein GOBAR_AA29552 [Gossypium barbadense]|uniref:Alpha-1,4 glucan phosphorylase n=1 Tax=Gossypium barbadense TaxID=3634 RepID=A0A2P5WJ64_GOSBA|nr:hypothetical protein GOBAR_AA29552 [Gossypium barbadense]